MPKYTTLSGHEITHDDPPRDVAAFLNKLRAMLDDDKVNEQSMIGFAYGPENPLLDHTLFAGRGAVTKETLADPLYHVMADLLARKHAHVRGIDVEKVAAEHTVSVTEAAERLGVHPSAIRQAIAARRLPSWVKGGQHFMRHAALEAFRVGNRGPKPEGVGWGLEVRIGSEHGATMKLKGATIVEQQRGGPHVVEGKIDRWTRIAVFRAEGSKASFVELEPDDKEQILSFHAFYVRGRFKITRRIRTPAEANANFRTFEP